MWWTGALLDSGAGMSLTCVCTCAAHKCNNFKGSIYMVFDYMDHDLTGLMERLNHKLPTPVVSSLS